MINRQVLPQIMSELPEGLWVVATPLGNIHDLSPRARMVLERANIILCEDTRRTSTLLCATEINRSNGLGGLKRFDAFSGSRDISRIVSELKTGKSVALVTDAGTPGISDPGAKLVAAARSARVTVTPVPGPSSVMALLSVCGFTDTAFVFKGFFPRKQAEREREIALCQESKAARIFVWFESPMRVADALSFIAAKAPEADVVAGKEITKIYEKFFAAKATETAEAVGQEVSREGTRGEWCFAVRFAEVPETSQWIKILECLIEAKVPLSLAVKQVSQHFGASRKSAYNLALKLSEKKFHQGG
ncbi:MAG: 16S rRNA (cytidine(1402)-2'-O)-methyltransferase [Bdellovibrionota bacterium]